MSKTSSSLLDKTIRKREANSLKHNPDIRVDVLLECTLRKLRMLDKRDKLSQFHSQLEKKAKKAKVSVPEADEANPEFTTIPSRVQCEDVLGLDIFFKQLKDV